MVCSIFLLAMQAGENLRTGYQLLVDMMVITYFIPFLYMFLAAWRLTGLRAAAVCRHRRHRARLDALVRAAGWSCIDLAL